ncbi:hypothetical protein BJ742DRAFT_826000 [Cladochytrium replicatum]|nr:hypothetical protein BJ742DRAFT_826000 [Cladochytrium replicatum]
MEEYDRLPAREEEYVKQSENEKKSMFLGLLLFVFNGAVRETHQEERSEQVFLGDRTYEYFSLFSLLAVVAFSTFVIYSLFFSCRLRFGFEVVETRLLLLLWAVFCERFVGVGWAVRV